MNKIFIPVLLLLFSLLSLSTAQAAPSIGISSMYDVLAPGVQTLNKRIYNTGNSSAFVRVEVLEIDPSQPGDRQESAQQELNNDQALIEQRLLVTPLRLIIPPSGFQSVRMMWIGERDKERYFRIRFIPVMPEKNDGFGLDDNAITDYRARTIKAGLNVLAGYGSLAIIQPQTPRFETKITDTKQQVSIKNNGNATLVLEDIRHCRANKTDCQASSRAFVLPGQEHLIKKPASLKTYFSLIEGDNKKALQY